MGDRRLFQHGKDKPMVMMQNTKCQSMTPGMVDDNDISRLVGLIILKNFGTLTETLKEPHDLVRRKNVEMAQVMDLFPNHYGMRWWNIPCAPGGIRCMQQARNLVWPCPGSVAARPVRVSGSGSADFIVSVQSGICSIEVNPTIFRL